MNTENKIIYALTQCNLSDDVIVYHIVPWVKQIEFKEQRIPRILIDYTTLINPILFKEYNKLNTFDASSSIPLILSQMKSRPLKFETEMFKVMKYCEDYGDLHRLLFFMIMILEGIDNSLDIQEVKDNMDLYREELLNDDWDFDKYSEYVVALRDDQQLCDELFENLLMDHEFLLKMK